MQSSQGRRRPGTGRLPRRRTDQVEDGAACVLTAMGLILLILTVLVGVRTGAHVSEQGRTAERERTPVDAVLLDAPVQPGGSGSESLNWRSARYIDASGQEHRVGVSLAAQPPAGAIVRVWVDRAGRVAPVPPGRLDAVVIGVAAGFGIGVTGVAVLILMWAGVRHLLDARNRAAWAREWKQVEPTWSGRR